MAECPRSALNARGYLLVLLFYSETRFSTKSWDIHFASDCGTFPYIIHMLILLKVLFIASQVEDGRLGEYSADSTV